MCFKFWNFPYRFDIWFWKNLKSISLNQNLFILCMPKTQEINTFELARITVRSTLIWAGICILWNIRIRTHTHTDVYGRTHTHTSTRILNRTNRMMNVFVRVWKMSHVRKKYQKAFELLSNSWRKYPTRESLLILKRRMNLSYDGSFVIFIRFRRKKFECERDILWEPEISKLFIGRKCISSTLLQIYYLRQHWGITYHDVWFHFFSVSSCNRSYGFTPSRFFCDKKNNKMKPTTTLNIANVSEIIFSHLLITW